MLYGVDVSRYQPPNILDLIPFDFAIIKATEGIGWVSDRCDQQYQSAVRRGKYVGVYHFSNANVNPGINGAHAEAAFFIANIQGYLNGKTLLVLDHEEASERSGGPQWALWFMQEVTRLTGYKPMLYGSRGHICTPGYAMCSDYPLWVAAYGDNEPIGYSDARSTGDISPWKVVTCFQYGSQGRLSGYSGNLDVDRFYGDGSTWLKLAAKVGESSSGPTVTQLAQEVISGKWGNGQDRINRLTAAGYDYNAVQAEVNRILGIPSHKSVAEIAQEVIHGDWGNGQDRINRLTAAGYDYNAVQAEVNKIVGISSRKSNYDIATEVIRGNWGNGNDRRRRLTAAGYDYNAIMAIVNSRI